jgi:hypothetical protein
MANEADTADGPERGTETPDGEVSEDAPLQPEPAEGRRDDDLPPGAQLSGEPPVED